MTTLVLVHGMWCRPHVWQPMRDYFERRGYRVRTPSLLFHDVDPDGAPPPALARASVRDYADHLTAELDGIDDFALIGHSMGSVIAQLVAHRRRPRALVGLSGAAPANVFVLAPAPMRVFLRQLLTWGFWRKPHRPSWAAARWGILQHLPENAARELHESLVYESGRALFELGFGFADSRRAGEVVPRALAGIPKLFLTGADDRITPASAGRRTAALYGAPFEELPGHGHWLIGEPGWERVAERVDEFLVRSLAG